MEFATRCPLCGEEHIIEDLSEDEVANIERYNRGSIKLESVFSEENNAPLNRELIKTGICQSCWDAMFELEDEEEARGQGDEPEDQDGD